MPSDDPKFTCSACGKQYRWKPELAGRSAKCACGSKLVVPKDPPVPAPAPTPAPKKPVAPMPTTSCPICKSSVAEGAVLCVKCGYNFRTGKRLSAVVVETEVDEEVEPAKSSTPPSQ